MPRRKTREEFISDAIEVHGDKYDYSQVEYINNKIPVKIYCKRCDYTFEQRPDSHLNGKGCAFCGLEKQKEIIYGVGVNDVTLRGFDIKAYTCWKDMLERCYGDKRRTTAYADCKVAEEWHRFSQFLYWFDNNYVEGYVLDKDILTNGYGKYYSPQTCLFVPQRINSLFIKQDRGKFEQGVHFIKRLNKYCAQISKIGVKSKHIGLYKTEKEAFEAYKKVKYEYIREIADEYYSNELIDTRTYNAMYNFKILDKNGNY